MTTYRIWGLEGDRHDLLGTCQATSMVDAIDQFSEAFVSLGNVMPDYPRIVIERGTLLEKGDDLHLQGQG